VDTNLIGTLPGPTAEVEAAFPARFQRDAEGHLVAIDQRSINIAQSSSTILSSSLSLSIPVGTPKGGGTRRFMQVGLSQTSRLSDNTLILAGLPRMDRLAGDGGGGPRQTVNLFADGTFGRWRANLSANWRSGYRLRATTGQDGTNDLVIAASKSAGFTINYDLQQRQPPFPVSDALVPRRRNNGVSLSLNVSNIFDQRPKARLGDGRPAPGYRRNDQDPIGRTVQLSIAERF
jgi:outer membrane receptor protein involved in Fe transport